MWPKKTAAKAIDTQGGLHLKDEPRSGRETHAARQTHTREFNSSWPCGSTPVGWGDAVERCDAAVVCARREEEDDDNCRAITPSIRQMFDQY